MCKAKKDKKQTDLGLRLRDGDWRVAGRLKYLRNTGQMFPVNVMAPQQRTHTHTLHVPRQRAVGSSRYKWRIIVS